MYFLKLNSSLLNKCKKFYILCLCVFMCVEFFRFLYDLSGVRGVLITLKIYFLYYCRTQPDDFDYETVPNLPGWQG